MYVSVHYLMSIDCSVDCQIYGSL